jgi:2-dehydro-3-deoxyglucarate aldolase
MRLEHITMGNTKEKLGRGEVVLGGWTMIGHPSVVEIMAGEGFDFIGVDMEHTSNGIGVFHQLVLAVKGTGCDLLARLPSCNADLAKLALDTGAAGIIVPSVNTPDDAAQAVAIAKFPPEGVRGASLCRASDFGRDFPRYFAEHNRRVLVVIMIEHVDGVNNIDAILATPGIDAVLIGPYDLSTSMGLAGQLDHADVRAMQQRIGEACAKHNVPAGIHVVAPDPVELQERIAQGYRFIACGIDTEFVIDACRRMLGPVRQPQQSA